MGDNEEGKESTSQGNECLLHKAMGNQEGEEANPRGNEWEVVSLTASAYAAAPGPGGNESIHEEKGITINEHDEAETSQALFMSGHFVFPPSQNENLSIGPESVQIQRAVKGDGHMAEIIALKRGKYEHMEEERWNIQVLDMAEEFPGVQLVDEKSDRKLPLHGSRFDEGAVLHGPNVDDLEQKIYGSSELSGSVVNDENTIVSTLADSANTEDSSSESLHSPESGELEKHDDSGLPCGAWWKRKVSSLCAQAKDTNAFWSIFVAAAVMGLVIIGQRWQQQKWQILQQRWQFSLRDEKSGRILSRLKDVIVGGSVRSAYISAARTNS